SAIDIYAAHRCTHQLPASHRHNGRIAIDAFDNVCEAKDRGFVRRLRFCIQPHNGLEIGRFEIAQFPPDTHLTPSYRRIQLRQRHSICALVWMPANGIL
ncbi:MAG TPA: hypothetical protein VJR90_02525, partial [Gammaproteobacteria bacterium]|nr:hypothetical protein [Gammaproteobacteria bacterium]